MRERNGWTDDGSILRGSVGRKCPNCGSPQFRETLSREHCPACGLECDYWGKGANSVYEAMMARNEAIERRKRFDEEYEWRRDESNWRY